MNAYERAMAAMGAQLDEKQKKRLRDAAQLLDQGNAETRRTSYAQQQTGIMQDTQQLAAQGLAGNAYSGFQSGEQERRVKTRDGVYDMTQNTLNTLETNSLIATGQKLVLQKRAAEEERRRREALRRQQDENAAYRRVYYQEQRNEHLWDAIPRSQKPSAPAAPQAAKPSAWQAAYNAMAQNTGTGTQGLLNLLNMTPEERRKNQQEIYNAAQAAGGTSEANTMFGLNPIKNAAEAQDAAKTEAAAQEVFRRQQERIAPLDKETGTASIQKIDTRLDEIDALIAQADVQMRYVRSKDQYEEATSNLSALRAEKSVLEEQRRNQDRRMKATVYAEYMDLADKPDFQEKSKPNLREMDNFYRGINGMEYIGTGANLADTEKSKRVSLMPTAKKGYDGGRQAGQYLTDEEKDVFNYIFDTQGADAAEKYVEDLRAVINARYAGQETERFTNMADEAPILASAMSIFGTLAKATGTIYSYTTGRDIDPNSPFFMGSRLNQVVRSEVAANIADGVGRLDRYSPSQLKKMGYTDEEIARIQSGELRAAGSEFVGAALGFLYQTGMSIADFLLIAQTGSAASLTIMGTGAAADTVMEAKQRGASDGDALALGTVAGIAEAFFEKFSLDKFYKMNVAGKNAVIKNMLAQMGIEASEEFFTECTNILADIAIMGDNSDTRMRINAYKATGMSQQEAETAAHMDNFEQVMLAALGGAISGGVIGGGKSLGMRTIEGAKNGNLDLTDPKIQAQLDPEKVKAQQKKEQNAAKDAATRVQNINLQDIKATDANPVKATLVDVAAAELKGKGEPDTVVAEVKAVLDKQLRGEPITAEERFILISNPTIREAFNITEPVPTMRIGKNGKMEAAKIETQASNAAGEQKTVTPDFMNENTEQAEQTEQKPVTQEDAKPSAKSEVYKEQLAKSFVKDVSDSIGLTKETGAAKELSKAINSVMEKGKFSSDEQKALFDKITKDLPEGTNIERARIAFDDAVFNVRMSLGLVDRYEAARHAKKQQKAERVADANDMPLVKKALEDRKPLARQLQKIKDDNVFTAADTKDINYILDGGEVNLEGRTNAAAFKQRLEVERKLRAADQIISDYNKQRKRALFDQADRAISGSEAWKDKKLGIQYSAEIMERNFEDVVKNPAQAALINEIYMAPVHANEAEATRMKEEYRSRVKSLKLNNAEKKAVQLMGEGSTEDMIKAQIGETMFNKVNMAKVSSSVEIFRGMYDELIAKINDVMIRNGYTPIEYRKNYFPHFNDPEPDTVMKKMAQALGISIATDEIPTDIAGLTASRKPGKNYFAHMFERKGETTTIDAVGGFESYIEGAANLIYHTDDIQRWRALESALRYEHSNEAIKKRVLDIVSSPEYDPERQQIEFDAIFNERQGHLGKLVGEIREYTNLLANKKTLADRVAEADLERKMYSVVNTTNGRVAANMVGANASVVITQLIPIAQAMASTDAKNMLLGMTQQFMTAFKDDGFFNESDFLTNRVGSDKLTATWAQKASNKLNAVNKVVDSFVAGSIVRAQLIQNMQKGMSREEALKAANDWTARIMADRSKGARPTVFSRTNPVAKTATMFQLEVNNQLRHIFKDLPRALRDKGLAAIAMALFKLSIWSWIYNEVTEPITGRRAALDPVNILMEFGLDLAKKDLGTATFSQFMFDKLTKGEPWKLEDKESDTGTAIEGLYENIMQQMPFTSLPGALAGESWGRIPIDSAIPDLKRMLSLDKDIAIEKKAEVIGKEVAKPFLYLVMPFGGGQTKKIVEGISTVAKGMSTTLNNEGEERIQFATDQEFTDYLQAALFGKWSLPQAQEYIRNGFDMMTVRESEGYKAARAAGIDTDYMRVRAELSKIEPTKDKYGEAEESAATLQRRALMNWPGLTAEQKQMFDKYLIAGENGRSYDYSNAALLELNLMGKSAYEKAVNAQRQGIAPETYLDYVQLKKEYDAANEDLVQRGQETVSVNERMHDAIWQDEDLTTTQKFQLEAALTAQDGWMNKAMLAARAAVRNDKFYPIAEKIRDYEGKEPLSEYAWSVIRADRSLTPEQQLRLQEIVSNADNKTKMDRIVAAGVPKEPAYRYLAIYRDYLAKDTDNELDYSDEKAFKLAVSREKGLSPLDKMKITDAILGSDSKLFSGWERANVDARINPKAYYEFQMKWLVFNAKDENGRTIDVLRKQHTKEYLETLGLTQEQMEYLLFNAPGSTYTKW